MKTIGYLSMYVDGHQVVQVHGFSSARFAVPLQRKQLEEGRCGEHFQHITLGDVQPRAATRVQVLHYLL